MWRVALSWVTSYRIALHPTTLDVSSSRSLFEGEQSYALCILLHNARKSRHRRIKKRRRYELLAATSQLSLW